MCVQLPTVNGDLPVTAVFATFFYLHCLIVKAARGKPNGRFIAVNYIYRKR